MRSLLLLSPGGERLIERTISNEADGLVFDLAGVDLADLARSRQATVAAIAAHRAASGRSALFVRIHPPASGLGESDLDAVMIAAPDGILLPEVSDGADVALLDARLAVCEALHGIDDGSTRIIADASGSAAALLTPGMFVDASLRLVGLICGAPRGLGVLGARAAALPAIDMAFANREDLQGLSDECRAARLEGFSGKLAVDAGQVPVLNEVFASPA